MKNLKIFISIVISSIIALWVWYGLVFAWPSTKDTLTSYSKNIFLDSLELSSNKIVLTTVDSPSNFSVFWDCSTTWKYISSNWNNHIFSIFVWDKNCNKKEIEVFFKNSKKNLITSLSVIKNYDLYSKYLDYSTEDIKNVLEVITFRKKELLWKNHRLFLELEYLEIFLNNIIEKRKEKYVTPVVWIKLPTRQTKVPNSLRPYRSSYTDGIHQWWDFDAPKMTNSVAIDDGIVIRVVRWFTPSNFSKIQRSNLTPEIKMKNLDILRWNQVWLKTMKWDVAFYSHFEEISSEIKIWDVLKKGDIIWKIWATWVPEEWYSDFHMHIEIYKNPFIKEKAWNYTFSDIMFWDWYFKWKTPDYIIKNQNKIFKEN